MATEVTFDSQDYLKTKHGPGKFADWRYLAFGIMVVLMFTMLTPVEYGRVMSPDGQYSVIGLGFNFQSYLPSFPGQSGDKSGYIVLYDHVTNEVLEITTIPMLSLIWETQWATNEVGIKLINRWTLPRPQDVTSFKSPTITPVQ